LPGFRFGPAFAARAAGFVAVDFLIVDLAAFGARFLVLESPPSLEALAPAFAVALELFLDGFGAFFFDALEDAFVPFCEEPPGIKSPTACMALEPASMTTSAAELAAWPIRSRTPFDFFLLGITCSLNGRASKTHCTANQVAAVEG
jgi:hypothetical protein